METVYDAAGNAYQVESVDAREYVASGSYFRELPEQPAPPVVAALVADEPEPVAHEPDAASDEKVRMKPGPKPKVKD